MNTPAQTLSSKVTDAIRLGVVVGYSEGANWSAAYEDAARELAAVETEILRNLTLAHQTLSIKVLDAIRHASAVGRSQSANNDTTNESSARKLVEIEKEILGMLSLAQQTLAPPVPQQAIEPRVDYCVVHAFCTKHGVDYNETCVMVRKALAYASPLRVLP